MSADGRSAILAKALIAALVGIISGAGAGLWSLRDEQSKVTPPAWQSQARTASVPTDSHPTGAPAVAVGTNGVGRAAKGPPIETSATTPARTVVGEDREIAQRARALAQRADVTAILAIRDRLVRSATARGDGESEASKQLLAQVDRYLEEARVRRLQLDAEAFRNAGQAPTRPHDPR